MLRLFLCCLELLSLNGGRFQPNFMMVYLLLAFFILKKKKGQIEKEEKGIDPLVCA